ncbi:MAG: trifunctional transcriptional regulator/proline dehydrogenase/L-glutamate gamma-semialdehyde dehydrogenase, partial [Alphaproteobacteria bacterium]|nr:trifunctional transcriptional regulator/proline dehydrogenase/L-glutamate gamma-semialdehyde dehydrogenase [Alphaproteobacteria bacterium]
TGPKAGGPLYVHRLLAEGPDVAANAGELPGPVGERNSYTLRPKGAVLCVAEVGVERKAQEDVVRASGNRLAAGENDPELAAVLFSGSTEALQALRQRLAARGGAIVPVHVAPYRGAFLRDEVSLSVNTAAAGGNASLMTIG